MLSSFKKSRLYKFQILCFCSFYSSQLVALEKTRSLTPSESLLPMLTGLLAILGIIFILAFVFKRFSNFGLSSKNIKVVETQLVGNKEKLMIVQVQQQQFLIGVTGHTISQLGELDQPVSSVNEKVKKVDNSHAAPNDFDINTLPFGKIISQLINKPAKSSSIENPNKISSIKQREVV